MSNKFLKTYSGFQRNILREIFDEKTLKKLDRLYNIAKINRLIINKEIDKVLKLKRNKNMRRKLTEEEIIERQEKEQKKMQKKFLNCLVLRYGTAH